MRSGGVFMFVRFGLIVLVVSVLLWALVAYFS
jgi:hypothetical protein